MVSDIDWLSVQIVKYLLKFEFRSQTEAIYYSTNYLYAECMQVFFMQLSEIWLVLCLHPLFADIRVKGNPRYEYPR